MLLSTTVLHLQNAKSKRLGVYMGANTLQGFTSRRLLLIGGFFYPRYRSLIFNGYQFYDIKEGHDNLEFTKHISTLQASSSVARMDKLKVYKECKN